MRNRLKFRSDPSDYSSLTGSEDDFPRRDFPRSLPELSVSNLSVSQLASSFPSGTGTSSTDLALDLVLNQIAEQTRLATASTGVAIALTRSGDLVCRATTGSAPDLGTRLNPYSGLSGLTLQTGKPQHCDDAAADSRVDAAACRALRVRAILVVPILKQEQPVGLIEAFSADPFHFREHDIETLNSFCRQIVNNMDQAANTYTVAQSSAVSHTEKQLDAVVPENTKSDRKPAAQKLDNWTLFLTASVIALALFLGWLLGRTGKYRPSASAVRLGRVATASSTQNSGIARETNVTQPLTANPDNPIPPDAKNPEPGSKYETSAQKNDRPPLTGKKSAADDSASPGLTVSQNGKVVFRESNRSWSKARVLPKAMPPGIVPTPRAELLTPEAANQYLSYRVEPEYPEAARQQRIQGPVVLKVMVAKDGSVQQVQVLSGDPKLSAAASTAVVQWKFKPLSRVGQPVEFETQVTVNFKLP